MPDATSYLVAVSMTFDAPFSGDALRRRIAAVLFEHPDVVTVRIERSPRESVCRIDLRTDSRDDAALAAVGLLEDVVGPLTFGVKVVEVVALMESERLDRPSR